MFTMLKILLHTVELAADFNVNLIMNSTLQMRAQIILYLIIFVNMEQHGTGIFYTEDSQLTIHIYIESILGPEGLYTYMSV